MYIEEQARGIVVEACQAVIQHRLMVAAKNSKRRESEELIIKQMCRINSIANIRGKGRDDLRIEILEKAR